MERDGETIKRIENRKSKRKRKKWRKERRQERQTRRKTRGRGSSQWKEKKEVEKPRKGQRSERKTELVDACVQRDCVRLISSMAWRRADGSPVRASLEGDDLAGLMIPGENNET